MSLYNFSSFWTFPFAKYFLEVRKKGQNSIIFGRIHLMSTAKESPAQKNNTLTRLHGTKSAGPPNRPFCWQFVINVLGFLFHNT